MALLGSLTSLLPISHRSGGGLPSPQTSANAPRAQIVAVGPATRSVHPAHLHPRRGRIPHAPRPSLVQGGRSARAVPGGGGRTIPDTSSGKGSGKSGPVVKPKRRATGKPWTPAQVQVEKTVLSAMEAKHAKMEAVAKKSALADYWHNIKSSLHSERFRLHGFSALRNSQQARDAEFDDSTRTIHRRIRLKRQQLLHDTLSEMQQEKEMESESAYKNIQSDRISYTSCSRACQEARDITSGVTSGGNNHGIGMSDDDGSWEGSSVLPTSSREPDYMSKSDTFAHGDDNFSAGR